MLYRRPHSAAVEVFWEPEPGAPLEHYAWTDGTDTDRAALIAGLEAEAPPGAAITVRDAGPRRWIIDIDESPAVDEAA